MNIRETMQRYQDGKAVIGETRRYYSREAGYQDRLAGLPPSETSWEYFQGYCEALCQEIERGERC